jgi:hypothetical protein
MKNKKSVEVYQSYYRDAYFVENATDAKSALKYLEEEYPEVVGQYSEGDAKSVMMSRCLDCETFWVNDDWVCGDCGEMRLSKRQKQAYYFF